MSKPKFVYFGGEPLGVPVLEELKAAGYLPSLVVASPDRPVGRKHILTPPPVKVWAEAHNLNVIQPEKIPKENPSPRVTLGLDASVTESSIKTGVQLLPELFEEEWDLFIVVAYNHILPEWLINLPKHKTLNVHPSLLPLLRGASPIRSAILKDMRDEIGVSVMQLDSQMDHGPIITQKHFEIAEENWPVEGPVLDQALARLGGSLLAAAIPPHLSGDISPQEQEHEYATYCGRFTSADGELELDPYQLPIKSEAYQALLKIYALGDNPGVFFKYKNKRIKIHDAHIDATGKLQPTEITPEGKNRQDFKHWLASLG